MATSRKIVHAALAANVGIAVTKFAAAGVTGSAAMFSEGVHSLVDSVNELLLLHGLRRARVPPSADHPFGHGRELFFWSFIVALLVLTLGAGVALLKGIQHVLHPEPIRSPAINLVVLAISAAFEGASWRLALAKFRATKGAQGWLEAFRSSKDVSTLTVLLEDSAALLGVLIAFVGIGLAWLLGATWLDGAASIGIGLVLGLASLLLAVETKALLLGEAAHPKVRASILRVAQSDPAVRVANGVLTVQMGPDAVVAALSAEFEDGLTSDQIEACVNRLERAIAAAHPEVTFLFVKPQSQERWSRRFAAQKPAAASGSNPQPK